MGLATLAGTPFRIDPMSIEWDYSIKTSVTETVGGKVVQVFGTSIGDMTVRGMFSSWQEQDAFLQQVKRWVDSVTNSPNAPPLRFTYAPRQWDFLVYVSSFNQPGSSDSIGMTAGSIAPDWALSLHIVEDNGGLRIIKEGALKLYIERLAGGIGWKQTTYNGPLGDLEVQAVLEGKGVGTIQELLLQEASGP